MTETEIAENLIVGTFVIVKNQESSKKVGRLISGLLAKGTFKESQRSQRKFMETLEIMISLSQPAAKIT